ncbi:MAG: hypothetical protein P4L39_10065 [Humidesulfovibrio sp.]|nr:hypothetical protein [Humidesulfovibrio sp.]
MSWRNGPWRLVGRHTHLDARAQRRLWRGLILGWGIFLLSVWAVLSAVTRAEEKAGEEAGQTYVTVAPLAAEVMDLRDRRGQFGGQPPLLAAGQVAHAVGITSERLRIQLDTGPEAAPAPAQTLTLHAQALDLRELVDILRDLRVEADLRTLSAHLAPTQGADNHMDLDLVLTR